MAGIMNHNGVVRKDSRLYKDVTKPVLAGGYNEKSLQASLPPDFNNKEQEIQPHTRTVLIQPKKQYAVARKGGPSPTTNVPAHPSKTQPVPVPIETPMHTVQHSFPPSFGTSQNITGHHHTSSLTRGRWSMIKTSAAGV